MRRLRPGLVVTTFALLAACHREAGPSFAMQNNPANLTALFAHIREAANHRELATAGALSRALVPDAARLRAAFRDDAPLSLTNNVLHALTRLSEQSDMQLAAEFARYPERTEVRLHAATTEDLVAYTPGTVAAQSFPTGAQVLAQRALRPRVTFYEVDLVEPGHDFGSRFHMVYWDGARWTVLGPAWRTLMPLAPSQAPTSPVPGMTVPPGSSDASPGVRVPPTSPVPGRE